MLTEEKAYNENTVFRAKRIYIKKRQYRNYNIPNHYDMFLSDSEDPLLFSKNIKGGLLWSLKKSICFYNICDVKSLKYRL